MKRERRTKIVATLGPSSSDPTVIERLFIAGADVFRINMSHTSPDAMRTYVDAIRKIENRHSRPIGVLADLQGPKLRLGTFAAGGVDLAEGSNFILDNDPKPGDINRVHLPHAEILSALRPGDRLLVNDGKVRLRVTEASPKRALSKVEVAGHVSDRKGVSLPDTIVTLSALTPKDQTDLEAALEKGVDWIGLSFIQRPEDIAEARKFTRGRAAIMSKIEKPQAITRLSE